MRADLPTTPIEENLISIIQRCRHNKYLDGALNACARIHEQGLESSSILGNYLVPAFVDCGSLPDAHHVFQQLPRRSEHSWTALISGCAHNGEPQEAFHLYHKMGQEGSVQPTRFTYLAVLHACAGLNDMEQGMGLHAQLCQYGLDAELFIGSTLVNMYSKCGLLTDARQVLDALPVRSVVSWNAMIAGYAEHGLSEEAGNCLEQMQSEGILPAPITFVLSLKSCAVVGAVDAGRKVHVEITRRGIEAELCVSGALVDMYAKCSSLEEAREVFEGLPVRDSVTWAALIAGYAMHGLDEEVLNFIKQMQLEQVSPDAVTFVCSLKGCGAPEAGQLIHAEITKQGLDRDLYVCTSLVVMYATSSLLTEAHQVSDRLEARNQVLWNALIAAYVEHGLGDEALKCSQQMQLEGCSPDPITFVSILKASSITGAPETGYQIHREVIIRGFGTDVYMGSTLVDMYINCGSLAEACQIFYALPVRDAVVWSALIAGYADHGLNEEVLECFQRLQLDGISADASTFVYSLKSCSIIGALDTGQELHVEIYKRGLDKELHVGNTLVTLYSSCGLFTESWQVFSKLPVQDIVSWNALITGFTEGGLAEAVLNTFQQIHFEGLSPDCATYVCCLKACSTGASEPGQMIHTEILKRGLDRELDVGNALVDMYNKCSSFAEAHQVFDKLTVRDIVTWNVLIARHSEHKLDESILNCLEQMQVEGVCPDSVTLVCSLEACSAVGALSTGQFIYSEIMKRGLEKELHLGNILVDMYANCSLLVDARQVFDRLPVRDVVSWNTLISGYTEHGLDEEVLECLTQMQMDGVSKGAVTFVMCLKSCGNIGALEIGREVHTQIIKLGADRDLFVANTLVDMYGKCSSVAEGCNVFDSLPARNVVSWNTMMKVCGENHQVSMAVQLFKKMQEQGVKPDSITFTCLLAACSHANLVFEGQEYLKIMRQYEIVPTVDHYACIVDLCARAGHVCEAEKFIAGTQCSVSSQILMPLLSACKTYGEMDVGYKCFQKLLEMNQDDASAYLLMTDLYTSAGRWSDANRVLEMRAGAGAKKKPGTVSVEVNKKVYEFGLGIKGHSENITEILILLSWHMRDEGYVPSLNLVLKHDEAVVHNETFVNLANKSSLFLRDTLDIGLSGNNQIKMPYKTVGCW